MLIVLLFLQTGTVGEAERLHIATLLCNGEQHHIGQLVHIAHHQTEHIREFGQQVVERLEGQALPVQNHRILVSLAGVAVAEGVKVLVRSDGRVGKRI
mgnify:CR=1 FL=1